MRLEFDINARFWRIMGRMGDLMMLNILFILTSLPLITIGAAQTAMYSVLFRLREDKETGIVRDYFAAFKGNFINATILWMLYALFAATCVLNVYLGIVSGIVALVLLGVVLALVTMVALYSFAMLARFHNNLVDTILKSVVIGASGLPYTIVMFLMPAAALLLTFWTYHTIMVMFPIWLLMGFALIAYADAIFFLRVFRRFTDPEDLRPLQEMEEFPVSDE